MTNETDDNDDFDSSAADEPTAMWGADALKDLGLEDAAKDHDEPTPVVAPPPRQVKPVANKPVVRSKTVPKKRAQAAAAGPSWTMTIALAVAVAALVFFGVRAILG